MRILLSCLQSPLRHAIPAHGFWRDYFVGALGEAGHQLVEVPEADWAGGVVHLAPHELAAWKDKTWSATVRTVRKAREQGRLDFCLFYLYPQQVEPSALAEIQALGVPCVNFYCDNVREFARIPTAYRPFDLHWVPEFKAQALYRQAGLPHLFSPMPCWIPPHLRVPITQEKALVRFIGSADHTRRALLAEVLPQKLPLEIRGPGWRDEDTTPASTHRPPLGSRLRNWSELIQRQGLSAALRRVGNRFAPKPALVDFSPWVGDTVFGDEYIRNLTNCAVSLGINRYPSLMHPLSRPDTYSRLRDIEAPMAGACYLTEWTEGIEHLYELGTDIEVYRTPTELCLKARELLADPLRRQNLRQRAFRRAHAEHSIDASIGKIASRLGLDTRTS